MTDLHLTIAKTILSIGSYILYSACLHTIADKTGHRGIRWWAWVPILNFLLPFRIAHKSLLWALIYPSSLGILLLLSALKFYGAAVAFLVLTGLGCWIITIWIGAGIAGARHRSGLVGVLATFPVLGLPFLSHIAFFEKGADAPISKGRGDFPATMAASFFLIYGSFMFGVKTAMLGFLEKSASSSDIRKIRDIRVMRTQDYSSLPVVKDESFVIKGVVVHLPANQIEDVRVSSASIRSSQNGFAIRMSLADKQRVTVLRHAIEPAEGPVNEFSSAMEKRFDLGVWPRIFSLVFGQGTKSVVALKRAVLASQVTDITLFSSPLSDIRTTIKLILKMIAIPTSDGVSWFVNRDLEGVVWGLLKREKPFYLYELGQRESPLICEVTLRSPKMGQLQDLLSGLSINDPTKEYLKERFQMSSSLAGKPGITQEEKIRALMFAAEAFSNDWENQVYRQHLLTLYERFGMRDDHQSLKHILDLKPAGDDISAEVPALAEN